MKLARSDRALAKRIRDKHVHEYIRVGSNMSLKPQRMVNTDRRKGSFPCAFGTGQPAADMQVDLAAGANARCSDQ